MMVAYEGNEARRRYLKGKPKKWGFKIFAICGVSGMVYNTIQYGDDNISRNHQFSNTEGNLVLVPRLTGGPHIQNKPSSKVYFDNFFTSPNLKAASVKRTVF
ncbi:hypothetical protein HHI36_002502 [Cryptolaemus montrouzieri]|uniref:PiggyBac transposable element-derived protein domain-containing protein n=1 Tax=Cryptolaemus montrouzieri TaxID=559131 RepID=A0ABD2PC78_9CUCU